MKAFLTAFVSLFLLISCVFESPFAPLAEVPVNEDLLGRWETVSGDQHKPAQHMLVLQHSDNEYVVGYPLGENAMAFRAWPVMLDGAEYIQTQLIGTASGPVKREDRKFHLLKLDLNGDHLEIRTINPKVLGKDLKTTRDLLTAFRERQNDPGLFDAPQKYRRMK